jgi:MFS family permease
VGTSELDVTRDVVVVGFGVGLMMQTLIVAVQNSVGRRRIGVATASVQFFRTVGAMMGVSVMGAIVTARLGANVASGRVGPASLASALHPIFFLAIGLAVVAFVAVLFVPHIELRQTLEETPSNPELVQEAA